MGMFKSLEIDIHEFCRGNVELEDAITLDLKMYWRGDRAFEDMGTAAKALWLRFEEEQQEDYYRRSDIYDASMSGLRNDDDAQTISFNEHDQTGG